MPTELSKKGLKEGYLTQKQYDKLPDKLLDAIVLKKMGEQKKAKKKTKPKKKK